MYKLRYVLHISALVSKYICSGKHTQRGWNS